MLEVQQGDRFEGEIRSFLSQPNQQKAAAPLLSRSDTGILIFVRTFGRECASIDPVL